MRFLSCLVAVALIASAPALVPVHAGHPAPSPDGSRIAFDSDRSGVDQLYVVATDGTGEIQLTHSSYDKGAPWWSADGQRILFASTDGSRSTVHSVDLEGKLRDVFSVAGRGVRLSSDERFATYFVGPYETSTLFRSRTDGTGATEIAGAAFAPVWTGWWSPDGEKIAFVGGHAGVRNVWTMSSDGLDKRQVTFFHGTQGSAEWPSWSPDLRHLALMVGRLKDGHYVSDIWTIDLQTDSAEDVTSHSASYADETPAWMPDGRRIVFQSDRTGRFELWMMNADGSNQEQLTT